jgi:3-methyladenine DNA glycosylase AlkD
MYVDTASPKQTAAAVMKALGELADPDDADFLAGYFKTGPGQYGAGDIFIGVRVPATRSVVKKFRYLPLAQVEVLLNSPVHEHRLAALLILNAQATRAEDSRTRDDAERERLVHAYLAALARGRINNWDLVDSSAPTVLGGWLLERPRDVLFQLADSPVLWDRRVAVLASFAFIHAGDASTSLRLAERLLADPEPLMHKAVGWMLREIGKRISRATLIGFLDAHAAQMPRTTLSYATEHLSPELRTSYRHVPREKPRG